MFYNLCEHFVNFLKKYKEISLEVFIFYTLIVHLTDRPNNPYVGFIISSFAAIKSMEMIKYSFIKFKCEGEEDIDKLCKLVDEYYDFKLVSKLPFTNKALEKLEVIDELDLFDNKKLVKRYLNINEGEEKNGK